MSTEEIPIERTPVTQTDKPTFRKPIRLWPGVLAAALLLLFRYIIPAIIPAAEPFGVPIIIIGMLAAGVCVLAIAVWWLFLSRAPWSERLGTLVLMVVVMFVASRIVHASIAGGAMGYLLFVLAIPILAVALVAAVFAARGLSDATRRAAIVVGILLACGSFALIRTGGLTATFDHDFQWRWTKTPEERLLAQEATETGTGTPPPAAAKTGADWPGFRGADRDGIVRGVQIKTDWAASPPVEIWRRPIGPGWSSFAIRGDRLYTQEQRGNDEIVACYDVTNGKPIWRHKDAARFYESNGGPGPRGTPTLEGDRVYTLGATGILNALKAEDGSVVWSRNAATDTKTKTPGWGFAASPLVVGDVVVVATAGTLAGYDVASGQPRWIGPAGGGGYSSPHRLTIDGVTQVVFLGGTSVIGVSPADGKVLWQHPLPSGSRIVQPGVTAEGDVLSHDGEGGDIRRIAIKHNSGAWTAEERWSSDGLKPFFSDFVIHNGHAYGFDGNSIACMDVKDGQHKWKGGRYGQGQLVLLADQNLLLIVSEQGELALVGATPDQFRELARVPAIKGKTWNHPVVAKDVLVVRNGEEMAAFRLPLIGANPPSAQMRELK
ncbi:MAG TPA: PQQ-binding-like beta-propeller repeat protein [Pyrinomonadaceae bacterium]|nr:PQQ-binding-like beta-propeller repeat protein [Pyrinomonadaceae bacterium]